MKNLLIAVTFLALTACGGESESFTNAKIHRCNMEKYAKEVADGKDSQEKLKESTDMFNVNRDLCIEEGMSDFDAKIKDCQCE